MTCVETYNERVYDLLASEDVRAKPKDAFGHVVSTGSLRVRLDSAANSTAVFVDNAERKTIFPGDAEIFNNLIARATRRRAVGETLMNAKSSRSHAIYTLHIECEHNEKRLRRRGKLDLVDLAGSERPERSGVNGTRLKETSNVNKSLSQLRNVIRELAAKGKPTYRNSMLTKLLRPALSAGGKTLLIVNVSPTEESREETRGSLLFAQMSKEVELGKAKKNVGHA